MDSYSNLNLSSIRTMGTTREVYTQHGLPEEKHLESENEGDKIDDLDAREILSAFAVEDAHILSAMSFLTIVF